MRSLRCLVVLVNALFVFPVFADNDLEQSRAQIERLHTSLLEAMHLDTQAQREVLLRDVVGSVFDVKNIARISVGRTWRDVSDDQQTLLISRLGDLITATYAERFNSFNSQQFETISVAQVKTGHLVKTRLLRVDDVPVSLDYYLRKGGVFNVVADGVSDLSLRRADYNAIIKSQGFDALMQHIAQKTAQARASAGG